MNSITTHHEGQVAIQNPPPPPPPQPQRVNSIYSQPIRQVLIQGQNQPPQSPQPQRVNSIPTETPQQIPLPQQ